MAHVVKQQMSEEMRDCIKDCQECEAICIESVDHCLKIGGKHAGASHIRLLLDCAEICRTSADYVLRGSELY